LEGGIKRVDTVRRLVDSGVAVMGHIGLTPQGIGVLGGFRAQGRTAVKARSIVDDAIALQNAGAFALGEFM
jgi:3-methyl-2-oxobutanoate hydroxymethyltransferase